MSWNHENLWTKAALYYQRAFSEDRESELFSLWACLGLDLLARASIAKIHPALLADPQQPENIFFAFGYPSGKPPKSVPAKTVFHRLTVIVPEFKENDFKFCMSLMELRNAEVHSGELPFSNYPVDRWLPRFLKVTKLLAEFNDRNLSALLGPEEAAASDKIIQTLEDAILKRAKQAISEANKNFNKLELEVRLSKEKEAKTNVRKFLDWKSRIVKCPSCGVDAALKGEVIRFLDPKATDDGIEERAVIMPTELYCVFCELSLSSHAMVFHAGFGEQYTETNLVDPKDYYGIEFDPSDYFEESYMNE